MKILASQSQSLASMTTLSEAILDPPTHQKELLLICKFLISSDGDTWDGEELNVDLDSESVEYDHEQKNVFCHDYDATDEFKRIITRAGIGIFDLRETWSEQEWLDFVCRCCDGWKHIHVTHPTTDRVLHFKRRNDEIRSLRVNVITNKVGSTAPDRKQGRH